LGFSERIEALLRERHNNPNLRLYEYFDLIGGTGTGAVLAAGLAVSMDFYPVTFGLYFRYLQKLRTSISTI
jgi:patatin-like phospholipase/acyl hydrolase